MLQDLTDLDFDTYFDVASSNQAQQQNHRDILYHGDQQNNSTSNNNNSMSSLLNNTNELSNQSNNRQIYSTFSQPQQQDNGFDIFSWNINQQDLERSSPLQMSPISSPQSSSDGYTSHSLSPQLHSPHFYPPNQFIKEENNKAVNNIFNKKPMFPSVHPLHAIPGINIPSTPTVENGPNNTLNNNLPSPPLEDNLLSSAFFALNGWNKSKDKNNDEHEVRNWRKSSSRHEQLQQNTIPTHSYFEPGKQLKKVAHNAIERRYRNNINDRIRELKNVVPALYKAKIGDKDDDDSSESGGEEGNDEIVDGVEVAKKLNKATILRKATEYIQFLKHANDNTEQENMILQQIIAQMPGGHEVLSRFLQQKSEFEKEEKERLANERREQHEREKIERQRILRERAAQRAALAQLLPKPERRPYRRRQSSKNNTKSSPKSASPQEDKNSKMFMAAFMCLAFFSASPSLVHKTEHNQLYESPYEIQANNSIHTRSLHTPASSFNTWQMIRYSLYAIGILYIIVIPLALRWLRPRPIENKKSCSEHHHYAKEVPAAWSRLYTNLVSVINKSTTIKKDPKTESSTQILMTLLAIVTFTISLIIPSFILTPFNDPKPKKLAQIGAWIRLNEVECLGANPDITHFGMLHSCLGMLSRLHQLKRNKRQEYFDSSTMARVYATTALQFELCLPSFLSRFVSKYLWYKASCETKDNHFNQWFKSKSHTQVIRMLRVRNGFVPDDVEQEHCRNIFYSFVLPYITSPLDLVLYWQQLESLHDDWTSYLNGIRPVFSEKQLSKAASISLTTTAPGHMLKWWVLVGLSLESLEERCYLEALGEYTQGDEASMSHHHPSSNLLRHHQAMIFNMLQATTALQTNTDTFKVPRYLRKALQDRKASFECINQINSTSYQTDNDNLEANVLVLSSLAVHLRTLKALIHHQQTTSKKNINPSTQQDGNKTLLASKASVCIAELRDQIIQDLKSPYTKTLSERSNKFIQSFIAQADDALCQ